MQEISRSMEASPSTCKQNLTAAESARNLCI